MTAVIDAAGDPPPGPAIAAAAEALRDGDIIGVPTDTVYGLAADPWHSGASDRLFLVKGRPRNVELPVFVSGVDQAMELTTAVTPVGERLMRAFWPGPLTLVLPRRPDLEADLGEDDATIGLRCPDHPVPLALCREFGPYATTSANRHGRPPVTTAGRIVEELPGVQLVLDAGPCEADPSTVVDATGATPRLLRAGRLDWDHILRVAAGT
ncbi:MAG TPA: L-threonylcarbamoyladenylate synthase [Acidimicrobiales bacterium]|nr:L-threonylcarbamoyladenylate synthase [Acidimicrobiales bacterium]